MSDRGSVSFGEAADDLPTIEQARIAGGTTAHGARVR
jgi:hypothetical protein